MADYSGFMGVKKNHCFILNAIVLIQTEDQNAKIENRGIRSGNVFFDS